MTVLKNQAPHVPDKIGSLSIVFECPSCLAQVGMLTNPFETQLVTSLGVEIGGKTVDGESLDDAGNAKGKCPFSAEARKIMSQQVNESGINWTAQAYVRLQNIPQFVRDTAKKGIEQFAKDQGFAEVNEQCLDQAKDHFGM